MKCREIIAGELDDRLKSGTHRLRAVLVKIVQQAGDIENVDLTAGVGVTQFGLGERRTIFI